MRSGRITCLCLLLLSALCLSGCFDYQERIVLNKDASGTMEVDYWKMNNVDIENKNYSFPAEADDIHREVERKYTSAKVKLTEFNVTEEKDSQHAHFKVAFDNILDLNDVEQFQKNKIRFTMSGDKISLERSIYLNNGNGGGNKESDDLFGKMVQGLVKQGLSNIRFRFEIDTPYTINESNADSRPGKNRAVWKFRLSDVMDKSDVEMKLKTGDGSAVI